MKTVKYIWAVYDFDLINEYQMKQEIHIIAERHGSEKKRYVRVGQINDQFIHNKMTVIVEERMSIGRYKYLKRYLKNKKR